MAPAKRTLQYIERQQSDEDDVNESTGNSSPTTMADIKSMARVLISSVLGLNNKKSDEVFQKMITDLEEYTDENNLTEGNTKRGSAALQDGLDEFCSIEENNAIINLFTKNPSGQEVIQVIATNLQRNIKHKNNRSKQDKSPNTVVKKPRLKGKTSDRSSPFSLSTRPSQKKPIGLSVDSVFKTSSM